MHVLSKNFYGLVTFYKIGTSRYVYFSQGFNEIIVFSQYYYIFSIYYSYMSWAYSFKILLSQNINFKSIYGALHSTTVPH